jgi:hypothetical protein
VVGGSYGSCPWTAHRWSLATVGSDVARSANPPLPPTYRSCRAGTQALSRSGSRSRSAAVQGDDNDSYLLSYRDLDSEAWVDTWQAPCVYEVGMQTRRFTFDAPITTDAFRFEADTGDGMYSVSELEFYGTPAA